MIELDDRTRAMLWVDSTTQLTVKDIDLKQGLARLVQNGQAQALDVIQTPMGVEFITREAPNVIFIFRTPVRDSGFRAFYSRDRKLASGELSRVSISGACKPTP